MLRTIRLSLGLKFTIVACTSFIQLLGAQSSAHRKPSVVNITGEFNANGTCKVFADGIPVFHSADSAQSTYTRGAMLNTAPSGFETHEVWCAPKSPDQPMPPLDHTERVFVVMMSARSDKLLEPRTYLVRTGLATRRTAIQQANAALFGMTPQILDDSIPVRVGLMYLAGTRGTFVVTRVDSTRVVGTFTIRGQRALTM
ncbi:MAG TPA: hypothetical protein VIG47_11700 [Gemmatimonadaceae bacterium]